MEVSPLLFFAFVGARECRATQCIHRVRIGRPPLRLHWISLVVDVTPDVHGSVLTRVSGTDLNIRCCLGSRPHADKGTGTTKLVTYRHIPGRSSPSPIRFLATHGHVEPLGIPSIIFGALMFKLTPGLRVGGILFALNGVACIVGFIGIAAESTWLRQGSLVGGVLFLLALVPMTWVFVRS